MSRSVPRRRRCVAQQKATVHAEPSARLVTGQRTPPPSGGGANGGADGGGLGGGGDGGGLGGL